MATHPTSRVQRALDKASAMGGSARVRWMSGGWRRVKGTRGAYFVHMPSADWRTWTCQCKAGQMGLAVCKHRAACWLEQLRDQSRGSRGERSN